MKHRTVILSLPYILITIILILVFGLVAICLGDPPPIPSTSNTTTNVVVVTVDEEALYRASLRTTPRRLMEDGQIIEWSNEALTWHREAPYYMVQWSAELGSNTVWRYIGHRVGEKFTHNKPEGFYRVIRAKKPTPPPTHPAQIHPTNTFPRTVVGGPSWATGANARGFGQ